MDFTRFTENEQLYKQLAKSIRQDLHQTPELGFQEFITAQKIRHYLTQFNVPFEPILETGTIVFFDFGKAETLGVRADIDGLPIHEETGLDFQSTTPHRMHACGHDGHTTNLLLLAKRIKETENPSIFTKNVLLIFQPAEEGPGGAKDIVASNIFEKYNVTKIIGLHLFPSLEYGKVGSRPGPFMAQNGELHVTVHGKSAHGAQPHTGVDSIVIMMELISQYQTIISRKLDPLESAVITIGMIHGGDANNIIAETCAISGTVRVFSSTTFEKIREEMQATNSALEARHGCQIDWSLPPMYPPVINDSNLYSELKEITNGELLELSPYMLAEDFSYYQTAIPGLFFFLGTNDGRNTYPLHSSKFNFNTDVLLIGNELFYRFLQK